MQDVDYKYGIESQIRETLLFDTIVMEQNAEVILNCIKISNTLLGPNIDRRRYKEQSQHNSDQLDLIQNYNNYNLWSTMNSKAHLFSQSSSMIKLWNKMVKDGTLKAIRDKWFK